MRIGKKGDREKERERDRANERHAHNHPATLAKCMY